MNDRIPLYPGRVKMTPVAGQANTYDMIRADDPTQAGTPLNKASLLKDATAALYGLGTDAVPDDVLAAIGKYKQYWWKRRGLSYKEKLTDISSIVRVVSYEKRTIQVSDNINMNADGSISLNNPSDLTFSLVNPTSQDVKTAAQTLANKAPCYILNANSDPTNIFYLPSSSTVGSASDDTGSTVIWNYSSGSGGRIRLDSSAAIKAQVVSSEVGTGSWQYIQSSNRSAYPDSGTQDGYEYEYLGVPFDNAVTAPKIEVGSYVGTGESNTKIITGFTPKAVLVTGFDGSTFSYYSGSGRYRGGFVVRDNIAKTPEIGTTLSTNILKIVDNGFICYQNANATVRTLLNTSGETYNYFAIG